MRVVLDTNILVSGLLTSASRPGEINRAWRARRFTLLTCVEQFDELRSTLQKPWMETRIKPYHAGRLINEMRQRAEIIERLPHVQRSPDPTDDFLLALAEAGDADFLVTGDKHGLLALARHKSTRILSANRFAALIAR